MNIKWQDHIESTPNVLRGKPRVKGTRIPVSLILGYLASGNTSDQIIAEFPDGRVEPLVWLDDYKEKYAHPFLFRTPLELPAGTVISGIPPGATVLLLPEEKAEEKE